MSNLRETIKRINLPRKIGSIIVAMIVYVIIYNIYDPVITIKIDDIPVEIQNEEALTSQNKVYEIDKNDTIDIYIKGKQSLIKNLSSKDVNAVANLENLSITNSVAINVTVPKLTNEDIEIIFDQNNTIHLSIDNYVTKTFNLEILKENEISDKYYLYNDNCSSTIKISGAQEKIKQINSVAIKVDLKSLKPNYKKDYDIKLFDSFENEISLNGLTLNIKEYSYQPTVYNINEIPLNVNFIGNIPFGYSLNATEYAPKIIKITGNDEVLKQYSDITINYDISNTMESKKVVLDLKEYLPEGIILMEEDSNVTINIKVDKLILKEFEFTTKDLGIKNLTENHTYKYLTTGKMTLTIMGDESLLKDLTIDKIAPYIDVNNKEAGTYVLSVKIPETFNLIVMSENKIEITIVKIEEKEPEEQTTENNSTEYEDILTESSPSVDENTTNTESSESITKESDLIM